MSLTFKHISHAYDGVEALSNIELTVGEGEILSLLGPSGCGKTTLLNLTAGILSVQAGEINLNGASLASKHLNPPPEKRPIGLVFQEGALFPHLSVKENIAFGVADKSKHKLVVGELLEQIGLEGFGDRYPHTLSGGQQQRVALARALAPEPDVLLMDEPFANIDIILRRSLREETRRLLRDRNSTVMLVTHDPEEAMEVSDKIAIMDEGKITQHGTARSLYQDPASLSVAMLTGGGVAFEAEFKGNSFETDFGSFSALKVLEGASAANGWRGKLFARPHMIGLKSSHQGFTIIDVRRGGHSQIVTIKAQADAPLTLEINANDQFKVGQRVSLSVKDASLRRFDL